MTKAIQFKCKRFFVSMDVCVSGDALEDDLQSCSVSVSSLVTSTSAAGMASGTELPRKRKGNADKCVC